MNGCRLTPAEIEAEVKRHTMAMWKIANLAAKRWPMAGEADDFFQEARLGLLRAAKTFDNRRGLKFLTYAYWWMRQYCQRFGEHGGIVRVPRYVRPPPIVIQYVALCDEKGNETEFESLLLAREDCRPDAEISPAVRRGLASLDWRSREIIEYRFGWRGHPRTLRETAVIFGLTRERVRQLQKKAMARLLEYLRDTDANPAGSNGAAAV